MKKPFADKLIHSADQILFFLCHCYFFPLKTAHFCFMSSTKTLSSKIYRATYVFWRWVRNIYTYLPKKRKQWWHKHWSWDASTYAAYPSEIRSYVNDFIYRFRCYGLRQSREWRMFKEHGLSSLFIVSFSTDRFGQFPH